MRIGELLKNTRKEKQLTLREAEKATKIRVTYLEALEQEKFHMLPGRIYIIGFLKSYANFLGLNSNSVIQQYKEQFPDKPSEETNSPEIIEEVPVLSGPSRKLHCIVSAIGIVFLIGLGIWYGGNKDNPPAPDNIPAIVDNTGNNIPDEHLPSPGDDMGTIEGKVDQISPAVSISIEILDKPCWVSVTIEGKEVFSGVLQPGTVKEFQSDEAITVKYGNAGAAKVTFNGELLGVVGEMGQVINKTYK
ncbi:MAG: DUF4115 domain-containing protein [Bacillota bacterium]|nr:DUF4115 domain-containing protein [Bacillota bacterium]